MDRLEMLERKLKRERVARKEAERLLEEKSLKLFDANERLQEQYDELRRMARKTAKALQASEVRYQQLVEHVHDVVFKTDDKGYFTYVNKACTKMLGYYPAELMGLHYSQIVYPADKELVMHYYSKLMESSPQQNQLKFKAIRKDGSFCWVDQKVEFVQQNQDRLEIVGIVRDVHLEMEAEVALRNSEEKYRGVLENMSLGLLEVDMDEKILRAYDAFCEMVGYTEEELLGKNATDLLLEPEMVERMEYQNSQRREGEPGIYEIQLKRKDGSYSWVLVSGAPIRNTHGDIIGSMGIHYDISQRKALETDLMEAQQAAEKARDAEKNFLSNMSHEIRNPINAVVGMVNLLNETELNEEQREYLDTIHYSSELLLSLISGVLDIAKIEAGELESQALPFDIEEIATSVLATINYKAKEQRLEIKQDIKPQFSRQLVGDPTLLSQILVNLLSNAAKFTEEGEIGLSLDGEKDAEGIWQLKFKVWDTGIGMPEEDLDKIFESFKQSGQDTQVRYGGTGLGLAITKQIIEHLGGTIGVESTVGQGTAFTVYLPFVESELAVIKKSGRERKMNVDMLPGIRRILVVEDNPLNQRYVSGLLKTWKVDCDLANNGREAVELANSVPYDVILMDIRMPEMDGYEATRNIRKQGVNMQTRIVALTASALVDDRQRAMAAGCDYHLTKPFAPDQLRQVLENMVSTAVPAQQQEPVPLLEFSLSRLEDLYGEDADHRRMMMELFLEMIPPHRHALNQAITDNNWDEFRALAHKIKPNFDLVGLPEGHALLQKLERMDPSHDHFHDTYAHFERFFDACVPLIERELSA